MASKKPRYRFFDFLKKTRFRFLTGTRYPKEHYCILWFLLVAALFTTVSALSAVSPIWYTAYYVSGTVTSQAWGFQRFHGMRVAPSGLIPSDREKPIGSLAAGILALLTALQIKSLSWECLLYIGQLFRHDSACCPLASTVVRCQLVQVRVAP